MYEYDEFADDAADVGELTSLLRLCGIGILLLLKLVELEVLGKIITFFNLEFCSELLPPPKELEN